MSSDKIDKMLKVLGNLPKTQSHHDESRDKRHAEIAALITQVYKLDEKLDSLKLTAVDLEAVKEQYKELSKQIRKISVYNDETSISLKERLANGRFQFEARTLECSMNFMLSDLRKANSLEQVTQIKERCLHWIEEKNTLLEKYPLSGMPDELQKLAVDLSNLGPEFTQQTKAQQKNINTATIVKLIEQVTFQLKCAHGMPLGGESTSLEFQLNRQLVKVTKNYLSRLASLIPEKERNLLIVQGVPIDTEIARTTKKGSTSADALNKFITDCEKIGEKVSSMPIFEKQEKTLSCIEQWVETIKALFTKKEPAKLVTVEEKQKAITRIEQYKSIIKEGTDMEGSQPLPPWQSPTN